MPYTLTVEHGPVKRNISTDYLNRVFDQTHKDIWYHGTGLRSPNQVRREGLIPQKRNNTDKKWLYVTNNKEYAGFYSAAHNEKNKRGWIYEFPRPSGIKKEDSPHNLDTHVEHTIRPTHVIPTRFKSERKMIYGKMGERITEINKGKRRRL